MTLAPTPHKRTPRPVAGTWFSRAISALVERRMPYQLEKRSDKLLNSLGLVRKTVRARNASITVRRMTTDTLFIDDILVGEAYTGHPGYAISEDDTVLDIGGNIGSFAILAGMKAKRGRVLSFEPMSDNFALLQQNLRRNGLTNVTAVHAAVSDTAGEVELVLSCGNTGQHSLFQERVEEPGTTEKVKSLRLVDIFEEHQIESCQYLKLDCEGAEYPILLSTPIDCLQRIERVGMEYHGPVDSLAKQERSSALIDRLTEAGFRIDVYTDDVGFGSGCILASRRAQATG